jgi:antigen 43
MSTNHTLSSSITSGITLTASGADGTPFTITNTGAIDNSGEAESYGALTGAVFATVTNAGHVTGSRYGIYLRAGGLLTNTGSIYGLSNGVKGEHITAILGIDNFQTNTATTTLVNSGSIGASGYAVQLEYGGAVTNTNIGTINGGSSSVGVDIRGLPGTVLNAGSISGAIAVQLANGGYVSNASTGVLQTPNPNYGTGIELLGGNATVVNAGYIGATYTGIYGRGATSLDIRNSGTIIGAKVASAYSAGIWVYGATSGVTIENSGLIKSANSANGDAITVTSAASTFTDLKLIVDAGARFGGKVYADAGATNIVDLTSGASAGTLAATSNEFVNFESLTIASGATWTIDGDATLHTEFPTIADFTGKDGVALTGSNNAIGHVGSVSGSGVTTVTLTGTDAQTLSFAGSFGGGFTIANVGGAQTLETICFLPGTLIGTPDGEVVVEALKTGDLVSTLHNGVRPVKWIGTGKVLAPAGQRGPATPVIVRQGALGDDVPSRDLHVTKAHALYFDDVFIPVEFLVNHATIVWDDRGQEVTVYHVELDSHDVIFANGAPAETFRDDGNRWMFQNGFHAPNEPKAEPCAPVLTGGPVVDAVWRRLLDLAGPRPVVALTDEPDLHLVVDGERVDATTREGAYIFRLKPQPASVRIVSRCAAPAELGLARDPRALGVAVKRIALRQGTKFRIIEARDAELAEGFHAFEPDGPLRWTTGDAAVPASLFKDFKGPTELVLHVVGTTRYVSPEDARAVAA